MGGCLQKTAKDIQENIVQEVKEQVENHNLPSKPIVAVVEYIGDQIGDYIGDKLEENQIISKQIEIIEAKQAVIVNPVPQPPPSAAKPKPVRKRTIKTPRRKPRRKHRKIR